MFAVLHGSASISGNFYFKSNIGSLSSFDSRIIVLGKVLFRNNTPEESTVNDPGVQEGGGITSISSSVQLQGNVRFMY